MPKFNFVPRLRKNVRKPEDDRDVYADEPSATEAPMAENSLNSSTYTKPVEKDDEPPMPDTLLIRVLTFADVWLVPIILMFVVLYIAYLNWSDMRSKPTQILR